jgi:hypothetical protein
MAETFTLNLLLWRVTFLLNAGLIVLLLWRKNHRILPFFFLYALLDFLHGVVIFESYRVWGFYSAISFKIAWGTQGLVIVARALAVAEICRRVLVKYGGIWGLGWRIFVAVATLVLAYSWAVGGHRWQLVAVTADRSLELAIAVAILVLFLFINYYQVAVEPAVRFLAIGFFLYSCFLVLNDTVLERWLTDYVALWNLLGTLAFLASLLLWSWALRGPLSEMTLNPELLPPGHYQSLSPDINARLKALNEQLSHFWYAEGKKT